MGGKNDNRNVWLNTLGFSEESQAIHIRHIQIAEHDVEVSFFKKIEPGVAGSSHSNAVTFHAQKVAQELPVFLLIIDT
jgi:hypothetical protein